MQELSEDSLESPILLEASEDKDSMESPLLLEQEASSARAHPYFRFHLSSQSIPPILPAAMEQRISMEIWAGFWSKLEPTVRRVELFERIYKSKIFAFVGLFTCPFVIGRAIPERYTDWFMITCLLFGVFVVCSLLVRRAHLEAIRTLCRDEEENVFRSCGFSLECEYEWATFSIREGVKGGYRIYFLPFECNYRRIQVFDESPAWCGWNGSLISSVAASYENLPTGFDSLPEHIWDEFWSKMIDISQKSRSAWRLYVAISYMLRFFGCSVLFALTELINLEDFTVFILIFLMLPLGLVGVFANIRIAHFFHCRWILVREYASNFADHGVYMEYRGLFRPHWCGHYGCHYVYLYPLSTNTDVVQSGCCGSIKHESSVTKRMGGPSMV